MKRRLVQLASEQLIPGGKMKTKLSYLHQPKTSLVNIMFQEFVCRVEKGVHIYTPGQVNTDNYDGVNTG